MALHVADSVLARLHAWGIARVFGTPGEQILALLAAFLRRSDPPDLIRVLDESSAGLMACGQAHLTGELGVCMCSGIGAVRMLSGILAGGGTRLPILAIVGQETEPARESRPLDPDLPRVLQVAGAGLVQRPASGDRVSLALDRAIRDAVARPGLSCLVLSPALLESEAPDAPPPDLSRTSGGIVHRPPRIVPPTAVLRSAARLLNEGSRTAIVIGSGAREASAEVVQVAETLGAGVAKTLPAKDIVPDDLPFVTGTVGPLGTKASYALTRDCDTFLLVGTSLPASQVLADPGSARGVRIDLHERAAGPPSGIELILAGDAAETLRSLIPLLDVREDRSWRRDIEAEVGRWWELLDGEAAFEAQLLNPRRIASELSHRLPESCTVVADSGTAALWYAHHIRLRGEMRGLVAPDASGGALAYALAAKHAQPSVPVVVLAGDGALQSRGLSDLLALGRAWKGWSDPTLIIAILHNGDLNLLTWEMRARAKVPRSRSDLALEDVDFAVLAKLAGVGGARADSVETLGPALEAAFQADTPFLLDLRTDPDVPPLPPRIPLQQSGRPRALPARTEPQRHRAEEPGGVQESDAPFKPRLEEFFTGEEE